MKGVVFTEFFEMVEQQFGEVVLDDLLLATEAKLTNNGAYTAIGTYPHEEMVGLIVQLSALTETPVPTLLQAFGGYLAGTFSAAYRAFFEKEKDAFSFLKSVDKHIHVEVKKLYPDANLPRFEHRHPEDDPNQLELIYASERAMGDLALGLMRGCMLYYGEFFSITKENITKDGTKVRFLLKK